MNDWSKDINLETIKEYLQECAENDDYHYEQYQVDIVMHEYIRQKQVIEAITSENKRLNNIINELEKWLEEDEEKAMNNFECGRCFNMYHILDKIKELRGDKE